MWYPDGAISGKWLTVSVGRTRFHVECDVAFTACWYQAHVEGEERYIRFPALGQ